MAYDGSTWAEGAPVNSDLAADLDDYIRDLKIGVRSRMANEHKWSSAQTATGSDGYHTFVTLSTQTATPGLVYGTATQAAGIFADSSNNVSVVDKTGAVYMVVKSAAGVVIANGTGTLGAIPYVTSGGGTVLLAAGTSGHVLTAAGAAAPAWAALTPTAFGSWVDKSASYGAQQAATDGFVVASFSATDAGALVYQLIGYTDVNSNPSTIRQRVPVGFAAVGNVHAGGFVMPVKKNDYWKVVRSVSGAASGESLSVYWIPLGS